MLPRSTAVAALVVAIAAVAPAVASATDLADVYVDRQFSASFEDTDGAPDAHAAGDGYALGDGSGELTPTDQQDGWSIREILVMKTGSVPPGAAVVGLGGAPGVYTLTGHDLDETPSSFQDGLKPMIALNGTQAESLRPLTGPSDDNYGTQLTGPIRIYAFQAPPTTFHIDPPSGSGKTKTFSTDIACVGPHLDWEFGDGGSATDETSPAHTYSTTTTFTVVASAVCDDGTVGVAATRIGVSGVGPGGTGPGATPTPDGSATPTPTATKAPSPTRTATPSPAHAHAGADKPGSSGDRNAGDGPQATATATAAPADTPAPSPAPTPSPASSAAPRAAATPAQRERRSTPAPKSHLPIVHGRLIAAVVPVSAAQFSGPTAVPATPITDGSATDEHPAPALALPLGLLALAGLLGAGVWRERRGK
jgi:hypothetical protein